MAPANRWPRLIVDLIGAWGISLAPAAELVRASSLAWAVGGALYEGRMELRLVPISGEVTHSFAGCLGVTASDMLRYTHATHTRVNWCCDVCAGSARPLPYAGARTVRRQRYIGAGPGGGRVEGWVTRGSAYVYHELVQPYLLAPAKPTCARDPRATQHAAWRRPLHLDMFPTDLGLRVEPAAIGTIGTAKPTSACAADMHSLPSTRLPA
jgi:hypothetical protein